MTHINLQGLTTEQRAARRQSIELRLAAAREGLARVLRGSNATARQAYRRTIARHKRELAALEPPLCAACQREAGSDCESAGGGRVFCRACAEPAAAPKADGMRITDEQIEKLKTEAAEAGDLEQQQLCVRALDGDAFARGRCEAAIAAAQARLDD